MIVATGEHVSCHRAARTFGLVRGSSVRGRHLGTDLIAHLRNAVGGEIPEYTKMMSEAREQAVDRMIDEARSLGANAIVMVRFSTSSTMAGAAEVLAYGTAILIEPNDA